MAREQTEQAAMVVPVRNNAERLVQIQLPGIKGAGGVVPGPLLNLAPGLTFQKLEHWEKAKENPMVMMMLSEPMKPGVTAETTPERVGQPVLVEHPPVSPDNPLAGMKDTDAIIACGEVLDVQLAKKLMEQERRPRVVAALREQVTKIEKAYGQKKAG